MFQQLRRRLRGRNTGPQHHTFQTSPAEIPYQQSQVIVTDVPAARCRVNFLGLPVMSSPFVQTLKTSDQQFEGSALDEYYQAFQPETVGQLLGLKTSDIASRPAMAAVMPWWNRGPDERLEQVAVISNSGRLVGKEAIKLGASPEVDYGWQYYGPISSAIGKMEFERQVSVYQSIYKKGFLKTEPTALHGEFLVDGADWVWTSIGGKHRLNALIAMGNEMLTVSAKGKYGPTIVRRDESFLWPNVVNGLFDEQEALALFDRIMKGSGPEQYVQ